MKDAITTFITADGKFQFTVRTEFVKKHARATETSDATQLLTEYNMLQYLHNPEGPAIVDLKTGAIDYFVNGRCINQDRQVTINIESALFEEIGSDAILKEEIIIKASDDDV